MNGTMLALNWTVAIVDSPWTMHQGGNFNSSADKLVLMEREDAERKAAVLNAKTTGYTFEARQV